MKKIISAYKLVLNHAVFHYIVSGAISQVLILLFWRYSSSVIGLESIGNFHVDYFWVELGSLVAVMGTTTSYAKHYFQNKGIVDNFTLHKIIIYCSLLISLILSLKDLRLDRSDIWFILCVITKTSYDFNLNLLLVEKASLRYMVSQLMRALLMISFCFILGNSYESDAVLLLCFALSYMMVSIFFIKALYQGRFEHSDYRDSVNMIARSVPFMLVGIVGVISTYSTRLLSSFYFTASVLGIIGLYTSYTAPLNALIAAVNKFYFPSTVSDLTSKTKFKNHTIGLLRLLLILTIILSIVIKFNILKFIVRQELLFYSAIFYGLSIQFIPILVFTYYSPILLIEKPKYMLYHNLISLFFSITIQAFFYAVYGLISIPYVLSIIELFQVGLLLIFIYYKSSENIINLDAIKIYTLLLLCQIWLMFLL